MMENLQTNCLTGLNNVVLPKLLWTAFLPPSTNMLCDWFWSSFYILENIQLIPL
jgi:hypothetical protein